MSFTATTSRSVCSTEEPDAVVPHVRICGSRGCVSTRGHPVPPALSRQRFKVGPPACSGSFACGPRRRIEVSDQAVEHRLWRVSEEAFGGGGSVRSADEVIVQGGECCQPAGAEAVLAMVVQGQLAVAPFHAGAAALEEVGAFAGDGLDVGAQLLGECLQWGVGATQGFE